MQIQYAMLSVTKDQDWVESPYIASVCTLVLVIFVWSVWKRKLPVYLLDFQVYKPPDRFVTNSLMCATAICQMFCACLMATSPIDESATMHATRVRRYVTHSNTRVLLQLQMQPCKIYGASSAAWYILSGDVAIHAENSADIGAGRGDIHASKCDCS